MDPSGIEPPEDYEVIKEALKNSDAAVASAKIKDYLEEQTKIPLNIAVTGESGSGKSTFVNAFRGLSNKDEGAAPTGCVETSMEAAPYPHPNYPNVILWDLPGIGTTSFPAAEYLKKFGFDQFDFFILISSERFRENDVKLALEIKKQKKKFYFVRTKIDHNIQDEERSQRDFNAEKTLQLIRQNCIQGLQKQGVASPQVFLISSFDLNLYDFQLLVETMERELPSHKRDALLFAIVPVTQDILNKKKKAFEAKIKYYALLSALITPAPIPGLSLAVDLVIFVTVINMYKTGFGVDEESLQKLADSTNTPLSELQAVMTSPFAVPKVTTDVIVKFLTATETQTTLHAAEEGSRFISLFFIHLVAWIPFVTTYSTLKTCLNMVAEDAQNVLMEALGLNTSV
ncbi:interferon-inducible GTPase 5-like [Myripristis murdjan]|uniref:Interferon-inducible GTPase 5-like n=1 Tax=Myripristis murdjan TaxID=586833 RepID=A0A668A685_9TELE|nr:interferon-inducible GTPase 5-like [Myripristis murdjan]XP_029925702.1 interferon-inducible GTPase 5-like [Myripristis murdjan]XP_029925703.1 interferon-inducible GTPase 5-like [Myripristis murdjan]XP_029925705.1 interferon-inducible GTPase 5-like [Myripristis murdjan]